MTDSNKNIVEKYQFRDIFANAPISIWEEDFSAVGEWLACLRKRGIRDLNAFLKSEPQALRHALSLVRLVEVNNITLRLWEVRSKEELLDRWADLFADETYDVFTDELLAVWEGRNEITCQCSAKTATGRPIYYEMHWVAPMIDGKMNLGRVIVAIVDITDRKEKEEKLRQNEKNLQLAGQIAKIGHWSWDLISNEQTWSVETCRIFGIEAKMTTCKASAFSDYIHPEDQKMVARAIQDAVEGIGPYDVEFRVLRLDGTVRWVHSKGEINFDKNRQPIRMFGIMQDITERKQAEGALRESEERFRRLAENSPDMIYRMSLPNGEYEYVSPAAATMFGYPPQKWYDNPMLIREAIHPDWRSYFEEQWEDVLKGCVPKTYEYQIIHKNGSIRWLNQRNILLRGEDGQPVAIEGIVTDITKRKLAEEALRESEAKYRLLIENIPSVTWITSERGETTFISPNVEKIYGFSQKEIYEKGERLWLRRTHPDDVNKVRESFEGMFAEGKKYDVAYRIQRKDGNWIWLHDMAIMAYEQEGVKYAFGIFSDVTERKKMQEELSRIHKLESIGIFAGGIAHDLNNILSGIITYPELLLMELPPDSPFITPITKIKRSGEHAAAMVQDLLTLARRGAALAVPININKVIKDFLSSPEYKSLSASFSDIKVTTVFDETLPNIMGIPFHILKVIMNLVINSAEAVAEHGEITITTNSYKLKKEIKGFEIIPAGEYVMLRISDNGAGIASEHIKKIFEPFYTKKVLGRKSGTGLGMSVVFSTVKDHEGYIDVKSKIGEGTTISLYFPLTHNKPEITEKDVPLSEYIGNKETVLVVDDIQEQRTIVLSLLSKLGYKGISASSGEEAVRYLKTHSVDCIILDMIMDPGIDGLETYKRIIKIHPGQKALITSGFVETSKVIELQKLGAGALIQKPYTIEKLGIALKHELVGIIGAKQLNKRI